MSPENTHTNSKGNPTLKLVGVGMAIFVIVIMIGVVLLFAQSNCQREIQNYVPSPSRKVKAVVFSVNCGATTSLNTQVSVIPANEPLTSNEANTFVEDSDHGLGSLKVEVRWLSQTELLILHDPKSRVFFKAQEVDVPSGFFKSEHITIKYGNL